MLNILPEAELKDALSATYSRETLNNSKILRRANIDAFLGIDRNGLSYASLEHRVQLYATLSGEKIYIQFPGKESTNTVRMPFDFRPKLRCSGGIMMQDATFGFIWDILDGIGRKRNEFLSYVAAMFFRMGYMYEYIKTNDSYDCVALEIDGDSVIEFNHATIPLNWYHLDISDDVWNSLNNYIGEVQISDSQRISFEAFTKFVDLLIQNEDCKYYYRNTVVSGNENYNLKSGRTSTCDANLLIIDYLRGHSRISSLLNSFQKSRGVPQFRKKDYPIVTDGIVTRR